MFKDIYFLTAWIDLVDTWTGIRYQSFSTSQLPLSDLEVMIMVLENIYAENIKCYFKVFENLVFCMHGCS